MSVQNVSRPDDYMISLIKESASSDLAVAFAAQRKLATALEEPLRKGILNGPNLGNIYESRQFEPGATIEFPLDLLAPGEEDDFVAFSNPGNGRIPERSVESDYVQVGTYGMANSIDWLLRYAREARWDIVARAMQVMEAGFVKKMNDDGWHTILAAGVDRNVLIYDADASAGQFTKRLVSLLKTNHRRLGGGNSGSVRRARLSQLYVSPEAIEDVRNWGLDQVDDVTRREIYQAPDDGTSVTRIFGVDLVDIDELGENQQYQGFLTNELAASLQGSDVELVVGIDKSANDSFIMPVKQNVQIFADESLHRRQRQGFYGWAELGFAVLDNRRVILGSF